MSIQALRWAWKQSVKGPAKIVLVRLADHADKSHSWNPSIQGLAEDCGLSARTVQRALVQLYGLELVTIQRRQRAKSTYTLRVSESHPYYTKSTTGDTQSPLKAGPEMLIDGVPKSVHDRIWHKAIQWAQGLGLAPVQLPQQDKKMH